MTKRERCLVFLLWLTPLFAGACHVSESLRRTLHEAGAGLHYQDDLCPENWWVE